MSGVHPGGVTAPRPYLSLVACSRNDDHGGDPLRRTRASLECTFAQLERHGLDAEYVMVDWNPPADRPRLVDALPWPRDLRHVTVRVIEVEPEIHRRWPLHRQWPLFTVAAYNAGVRRARGEFVALSMIDHLYPDPLMAFLARRALRADRAYRFPRADVDPAVLDVAGVDARLAACKDHERGRTRPPERPLHPDLPPLFTDACGDFQLLARDVWHRLRGYRETDGMPQHVDSMLHFAAHALGVREEIVDAEIHHVDVPGVWRRLRRGRRLGSLRWVPGNGPAPDHWDGWTQPVNTYVPPPASWRDRLVSWGHRLAGFESGPCTAHRIWPWYERVCVDLGLGRRAHDWNGPDWGLGADALTEHVPCRAHWDRGEHAEGKGSVA